MIKQTHLHPEWKRLLDEIAPLLEAGKTDFSYAELEALSGVSILTNRGRQQFFRFRREASKRWQIWFENVRNEGYRKVRSDEHVGCAQLRTKRAKRALKSGLGIVIGTKIDELSDQQKSNTLATQAILGTLLHQVKDIDRKVTKIAASMQHPMLAPGLAEIEAITNNMKERSTQ